MGDSDESIHTDDDQHKNGGGTGPDIHSQPDAAPVTTKHPFVKHYKGRAEREDQNSYKITKNK